MLRGLGEITRKEIVAWNLRARERMLLRKSFYLPMDERPRRWVGRGERPEEVSVGLAGPCLWTDGHQPPPQGQRDNLDPGGFLYVENINQ